MTAWFCERRAVVLLL